MTTEASNNVVLPDDTSLLAFYRDMNVPERRTFWPAPPAGRSTAWTS